MSSIVTLCNVSSLQSGHAIHKYSCVNRFLIAKKKSEKEIMDNTIRKLCSETEKVSRTSTSVELLIANGSFVLPSAIFCDFS